MKSQKLKKFIPLGGINRILTPRIGDAETVLNCRMSVEGGWVANVGFQSWWKSPASWTVSTATLQKYFEKQVDSCYQWKRQNSNDVYTFVEQNGVLYYVLGNKGQGTTYAGTFYEKDIEIIDSNRYVPKLGDTCTQYINLGNHLLIINGRDRAILFSGHKTYRDFGFAIGSPTVSPYDVDTEYFEDKVLKGTAIAYPKSTVFGLGQATPEQLYTYRYKLTTITDTGAESPLSSEQEVSWEKPTGASTRRYAVALDLPLGEDGCVARRIYRTREINTSGGSYYFLKQIDENSSRFYIDTLPDRYLVDQAPDLIASTTITTDFKVGENWDNRLWLAKGTEIIYSDRGLFEQFGVLSYFEVGTLRGGDVTQLQSFYNNLIVFRESAINIISFDSNGFNISTITNTVGTTAPNSVVVIPQLGIIFLNEQGVYILTGGLNGGASLSVQKISFGIDDLLNRMNYSMIHKTIASYSTIEREVWIHFPSDDSVVPDTGIVLHTMTGNPTWSIRTSLTNAKQAYWSAMTTTVDGLFLLGTAPDWTISASQTTDKFGALQVMTNANNWGQSCTISSISDGNGVLAITNTANPGHTWESEWYNFNENDVKIRFYSVELRLLSYGDNSFNFFYSTDYSYIENATSAQKQARSETVYTVEEDAVFGAEDASVTKVPFTINKSKISDGRLIVLRYDVNTQLVDQFKFGIRSTNDTQWHLLSMNILSDAQALPALNQATRLQRGQSR